MRGALLKPCRWRPLLSRSGTVTVTEPAEEADDKDDVSKAGDSKAVSEALEQEETSAEDAEKASDVSKAGDSKAVSEAPVVEKKKAKSTKTTAKKSAKKTSKK